jgi:penicillin-binding protein 1A
MLRSGSIPLVTTTLVPLLIALAAIGCDGDAATPAAPQSRTTHTTDDDDDDLPRDLTELVDCRLGRDGGSSIGSAPIITVDRMPPHVTAAFLSAEDRRYYERTGSKPIEPRKASIVQQVVRYMPAITERCLGRKAGPVQPSADKVRRKAMQAALAARLEDELTRRQILSIYLNHVYLGSGAYGVVDAAKKYFGKELELLTIAEAALLGGLAAAPTKYSPYRDLPRARERRKHVLSTMREDRHISEAQYQAALTEPISLVDESTR